MTILSDLDPAQKEAVLQTEGPVLILAGAGSGKTRVLTYKVAYLMSKGVKGENILAVTFTNKAANEMKERIIKLVKNSKGDLPYVGTFHSFCAKLLRRDGKFIGLPASYLIYDDDDSTSLIKRIMKEMDISTKNFKASSILAAISSAKSELLSSSDYAQFARGPFATTVRDIYSQYQKQLDELYAVDFDDLLLKTVKLFDVYPQVLEKYAKQYEYVLVDEYQDVNSVQYKLTKQLSSVFGNLTVVGDASQAIYSFRGADFRNILNFESDFLDVKVFNLEQNYRSTQTILDVANTIISKVNTHPVLKLWTNNEEGEKVVVFHAQNELDEANFVIDRIIQSGSPYSSFAVLYRTNAQSRNIEEAFLRNNIAYKLYGGVRFYERKEIKDVLAYLRIIENPRDRIAKTRIIKLGKKRSLKFDELLNKIKKMSKIPKPTDLIDKVLDATEYLALLDDGTEQGLQRVENVKELKSVASDFENLTTFLENIVLMEGKITPEKSYEQSTNANSVTLMTVHAAKGLEFDNVFLIGLEEGLFPHSRSMLDSAQLEEERRLAYVAMTRARKKLYLTYAQSRLYFGAINANLPSRFVVDIPKELISTI